jgi:shikimate kinase
MKLFLIGLLGSGKSFLGKELAQQLKLPFIDLDDVLESQERMKVSEIFSAKGEAHFRKMEATALRNQSEQKEFVMATGGGTPCFHDNLSFINQAGISVFLNTPISEIVKRLQGAERKSRPLLANVSDDQLQPTLEAMLQSRMQFYKQAHFTVNGATVTAQEILNLVQTKK